MENIRDSANRFEADLKARLEKMTWCPKCNHGMQPGEPCENCRAVEEAARQAEIAKKAHDIKRLGGLRAYEDFTLEKLDSKFYNVARALELAKGSGNLYIWGSRGTGKTHLATALVRRKDYGLLVKPQNMLRLMRDRFYDSKREANGIEFFVSHRLLCIDDLGTEPLTPHTRSLLYEIIDGRWLNKKTGMIITSNFSPDDLATQLEADRIASRIAGMCKIIRLGGDDRRIKN